MKRASGYLLRKIEDVDYLIPYGQGVVEHKSTIALNEPGVFLWNLLEKERTREELREEYLKRFMEDEADRAELTEDLNQFLQQLISCRVVEETAHGQGHLGIPSAWLQIGGLTLAFHGPRDMINGSNLKAFCIDHGERADQDISIIWGTPGEQYGGTVLVHNNELIVCEGNGTYSVFFPTLPNIYGATITKDGKDVRFYCELPMSDELSDAIFHACRFTFLYLAQMRGMFALHSVSVLYRDRAWLFSASSGTGKSTHANLWKTLYETPILNGDLNLLAILEGKPVILGIPWCGTSEIFETEVRPLGGIIFLRQAMEDKVTELPPDQKTLRVLHRLISPTWTEPQLEENLQFAGRLASKIRICQLQCTKNPSAAEAVKNWIDQNDRTGK